MFNMDFEYFQDRQVLIDTAMPNGIGFGYRTSSIVEYKNVVEYIYPKVLQGYINSFEDILSKVDMGGAFNKQRLKLTSDERGVFSFGSASTGLYIPREFYSLLLEQELPNEFPQKPSGIVPAMYVEREKLLKFSKNDEYTYFYTSKTNGKTYQLVRQKEGTREMELGLRENYVHRTTQKKCYVILPKKGGKAKMVDLYIPKNKGITLEKMLPSLMLSHFLRLYGVMTRINVIRVFDINYEDNLNLLRSGYLGFAFKVKDFGEDLDFNRLALEGADERTWDLVRDCVGNIQQGRRNNGLKMGNPKFYGSGSTEVTGGYPTGTSMIEFMARFRNFYQEKMEKGEVDTIPIDKKLMLMGYCETYGSDKKVWEAITKKFYELLDVVDTQFNGIQEACKRIYKREVEDSQRLSQSEFKPYMVSIFNLSYLYPVGGDYAESQESMEKTDMEYEEKLEGLDNFLQGLI